MASCPMAESPYPSQVQDKFVLRLPDGMRDRIKAAAEANNRSMNAEIVAALEERYPAPTRSELDEMLDELQRLSSMLKDPDTEPQIVQSLRISIAKVRARIFDLTGVSATR
jgi:hypothetical protein